MLIVEREQFLDAVFLRAGDSVGSSFDVSSAGVAFGIIICINGT
jgi:hypothetical protein